jgi:hypothetical protein
MRGGMIPLSVPRRMVVDLLHFGAAIPSVPVQRRMSLAPLVRARAAGRNRPRWTAIFAKAFALTAREFPELRRAYVKLPWPMLYEYPLSNASVIVERDYLGEPCIFSIIVKDPASRPLPEIGKILEQVSAAPIEAIKDFRRSIRIAKLPLRLRRALWWVGLNFGRQRGNYFGTFSLSVYSALNAESLHPLSPLTVMLNYGVIDADGAVNVRIIHDNRVMDEPTVGRALARMEAILNTVVAEELNELAAQAPRSSMVSV